MLKEKYISRKHEKVKMKIQLSTKLTSICPVIIKHYKDIYPTIPRMTFYEKAFKQIAIYFKEKMPLKSKI